MIVSSLPYPSGPTYGPELVTNGTFDTNSSGWTTAFASVSVSGGQATVTESSSSAGGIVQSFTTVIGATYKVDYDATNGTGTAVVDVADSAGSSSPIHVGSAGIGQSYTFVADATTTYVRCKVSGGTNKTGIFDNISVKEVLS